PMNPAAAARANAIAGNPAGAVLFETALGGLEIEAVRPVALGFASGPSSSARHALGAGERFRVPAPTDAVWSYLAVSGGLDVPSLCGSASHGPARMWGADLRAGE